MSEVQLKKQYLLIVLTLEGVVIDVRLQQQRNAECPMLVTLSGMVTVLSDEQLKKRKVSMVVILSGITIDVKEEQDWNA